MATALLIIGALLLSGALVAAFRNLTAAAALAYAGVWSMRTSGYAPVSGSLLIFWAIAVVLVTSITLTRGSDFLMPARSRYFIVGGALAGMAAGLLYYQAGIILGSAAGAVLGAIAYAGLTRQRDFRAIARYIVAAGLPAVVTMSLLGIAISALLIHR